MEAQSPIVEWWTAIIREGDSLRVFPLHESTPLAEIDGVTYGLVALAKPTKVLLYERVKA